MGAPFKRQLGEIILQFHEESAIGNMWNEVGKDPAEDLESFDGIAGAAVDLQGQLGYLFR